MSELREGGRAVLVVSEQAPRLIGKVFNVLCKVHPAMAAYEGMNDTEEGYWLVEGQGLCGLVRGSWLEGTEDVGDDENQEIH